MTSHGAVGDRQLVETPLFFPNFGGRLAGRRDDDRHELAVPDHNALLVQLQS